MFSRIFAKNGILVLVLAKMVFGNVSHISSFAKELRETCHTEICCLLIGLFDRDVTAIEMALARGIPCATVIGGGYDDDIDVLGRRHSIIHRAALKVSGEKNKRAKVKGISHFLD